MKKLRGGHIVVAVVRREQKSRPSVVTFKKVPRTGRKPNYKIQKEPTTESNTPPPTQASPSHRSEDFLFDDSFISGYDDKLEESEEVIGGEDGDVRLPRRATVRDPACFLSFSSGA